MSFASLRRVLRSARKGLCSTCAKTRYPQLEAAGAGHVGCLIYTLETLGQLIADEHRVTAMHVAARKGQIEVLIYLVENDMVRDIPRAKNGATPAHDAAGTGNLACLRYLMKQTNINVNDVDGAGQTILHWAALSGNLETVHFLVVEGQAAIDAADKNGLTAFHIAAVKNNLPILKFLTGFAYKRHPKPQRLLNAKNKSGMTPICCAAQAGHVEIVRWLATKGGGDPTILNAQGAAPLHVATMAGQLEVVKYLYQFGSATGFGGLRSSDGSSALHFAASSGFTDIMKWLLEQKHCTGGEVDYYQRTPLHCAAESGQLKAIQMLCEYGVNIQAVDDKGNLAVELSTDSKCTKYLQAAMKKKPSARTDVQSHSKVKVTDNLTGLQPPPLEAFIEEGNMPFEEEDSSGGGWETLQDLMNQSEIQQLNTLSPGNQPSMQENAEKKRRELEEKLRKEEDEKRKKKEELLRQEDEAAKKIRQQLIEDNLEDDEEEKPLPVRKNGKLMAEMHPLNGDKPPLKQPNLPSHQVNNVLKKENDTKEVDKGGGKGGGIFSKFWSKKNETKPLASSNPPQNPVQTTQPQAPTMETSDDLGNLHKIKPRASRRRIGVMQEKSNMAPDPRTDHLEEIAPSTLVPSSSPPHGRRQLQRRPTPHPHHTQPKVPSPLEPLSPTQSMAPKALNFDSTPLSSPSSESVSSSSPFYSPSPAPSISPIMSPSSSFHSMDESLLVTPTQVAPTSTAAKRVAPPPPSVPPPSPPSQIRPSPMSGPPASKPPSLPNGFRHMTSDSVLGAQPKPSLDRQNSVSGAHPFPVSPNGAHSVPLPSSSPPRADSPTIDDIEQQLNDVLKILTANISKYDKERKPHPPKGNEEEEEEEEDDNESGSGTPSSSEEEDGEEEEEEVEAKEGSSPEEDDNENQTHHRRKLTPPVSVTRPVMARNVGMGRTAGLNNVRKQTRYPRLLRKKVVNLDTIEEIQDEIIHEANSEDDQAYVFYKIHSERRIVHAWRRYVILSKITQRKALALAQKKQKDQLSKVFTAWRQAPKVAFQEVDEQPSPQPILRPLSSAPQPMVRVPSGTAPRTVAHSQSVATLQHAGLTSGGTPGTHNEQQTDTKAQVKHSVSMGTISSTNLNKAKSLSVQSMPQVLPKETYVQWLNQHLTIEHKTWQDMMVSLEGGVNIIQALATASGKSAPRYNPNPKLPLHRQDNWRVAYEFMKNIGINVKGVEPADLASGSEPAMCNMFASILKWQDSSSNSYSVL